MPVSATTTLHRLGWAFALIPVVGACLWFLTGDLDDERNRSPIDLTQLVELAILFVAVRAGLGRGFVLSSLTRPERWALAILATCWCLGLILSAPEPLAGVERTAMRLPPLGAGIGLCFLLSRAGVEAAGGFPRFFMWQPLLHIPVVVLLLLVFLDEPRLNWLGGPVGFWHVRVWGVVIAAGVAAAVGLHAARWRPGWRSDAVLFAGVLVLGTLLAWSGSRSAMLGLGLAYLVMVGVVRGPMLRGVVPAIAGLGLGVVISLTLPLPDNNYGLVSSITESQDADLNRSSGGRLTLWTGTLDHVLDKPLIGHGFDQFRYVYKGEPEGTIQPHNAVLQLFFDFGLIGGSAAILLLLSLWWRAVGDCTTPGREWKLPAVMVLNTMAVTALFDGSLYHAEPLALIALSLGILLSQPKPA